MCARQIAYLAPDWADLVAFPAVKPYTFIKNHIPHCGLLDSVVVSLHHHLLVLSLLFRNCLVELFLESLESISPLLFCTSALCDGVASVVAEFLDCGAELFIVLLVAVGSLDSLACLLGEFHLHLAVLLDFFVSELDGLKHFLLAHFLHLTFDHQDVVVGGSHHYVDVRTVHHAEIRVDDQLTVNSCNAYLGNRPSERNVADCKGS